MIVRVFVAARLHCSALVRSSDEIEALMRSTAGAFQAAHSAKARAAASSGQEGRARPRSPGPDLAAWTSVGLAAGVEAPKEPGPEVDIGRVAVGNNVAITIDAFPGEQFKGVVSYIDPAETIVDGVVNYKTTITFTNDDPRLRSGLTVNLFVETKHKDGVLIIPQYAVLETDQGTYALKQVSTQKTQVPITIGIRGEDGNVEVLTGLNEGDTIYNVGLKTN